jgi:hypothetical protein
VEQHLAVNVEWRTMLRFALLQRSRLQPMDSYLTRRLVAIQPSRYNVVVMILILVFYV